MAIKHSNSTTAKGDILLHSEFNADHVVDGFESFGPITLSGDGLVEIELRPHLDFATLLGQGKPSQVTRGVFKGYSLPVYNNDNEELFLGLCAPNRWDGASDISVHVYCWLSGAEDTKNFNLQLAWEKCTPGTDTVPETVNVVTIETPTGASAAQYQSYEVEFTIDHDIDTPDILAAGDCLSLRLRRIDASANECDGEIIIEHVGVVFRRDKLGTAST